MDVISIKECTLLTLDGTTSLLCYIKVCNIQANELYTIICLLSLKIAQCWYVRKMFKVGVNRIMECLCAMGEETANRLQ